MPSSARMSSHNVFDLECFRARPVDRGGVVDADVDAAEPVGGFGDGVHDLCLIADVVPRVAAAARVTGSFRSFVWPRNQRSRGEIVPVRNAISTSFSRFRFWGRSSTPNLWNSTRRCALTEPTL